MSWVEQKITASQHNPEFLTHLLVLDITEQIAVAMKDEGIRRSDLARRLGVSRPYVTKVLEGRPNLTVQSLARIALALNSTVSVKLEPRSSLRTHVPQHDRLTNAEPSARPWPRSNPCWWQRGKLSHKFEVVKHEPLEAQSASELPSAA